MHSTVTRVRKSCRN